MTGPCPSPEQRAALLAGTLEPDAAAAVRAHLAGCSRCADTLTLPGNTATHADSPGAAKRSVPSAPVATGDHVGRYVIEEPVGSGGMGVVFRAYDPQLDRRVALKLVRITPDEAGSTGDRSARLLREAQAMARLSHPNVLQVHDAGQHGGLIFLAMELVQGQDLKAWLKQPRPWREVVDVFCKAAEGLAAAHAAGIVHRDFKPANVLLGHDGRVYVADFGIARASGEAAEPMAAGAAHNLLATPLTSAGSIIGTLAYVAPELFDDRQADARSDQFSFCVSLHEALYGKRPFAGPTYGEHFVALQRGPPKAPPSDAAPERIYRVIARGLAQAPENRYPSMAALLAELKHEPRVGPWRYAAAALVALAAAAAFVVTVSRRPPANCGQESARLKDSWDEGVRGAVRDAFTSSQTKRSDEAFEHVAATLDAYAAKWVVVATVACAAQLAPHDDADRRALMVSLCVEHSDRELKELTRLLRHADPSIVEVADDAASSLPELSACFDEKALLRAALLQPVPTALRARSEALQIGLARAQVLYRSGKLEDTFKLSSGLEADASDAGLAHDDAEALMLMGSARLVQDHNDQAEALLSRALAIAEASGDDEQIVRVASRLGETLSWMMRNPEAERALHTAEAAWQRLGRDERLAASLLKARSILTQQNGDADGAVDVTRRLVELQTKLHGPRHRETLKALNQLGTALYAGGRVAESVVTYREIVGAAWADTMTPLVCFGHDGLAASLMELGETAAAREAEASANACFDERQGPRGYYGAGTLVGLAKIDLLEGDATAAQARAAEALTMAKENSGAGSELAALALQTHGRALLAAGSPKAAYEECHSACAIGAPQRPKKAPDTIECLICEGQAALSTGRREEGVASLEHAVTLAELPGSFLGQRSAAHFALAKALAKTAAPSGRACALAKRAFEELEGLPARRPEQQGIGQWLARCRL